MKTTLGTDDELVTEAMRECRPAIEGGWIRATGSHSAWRRAGDTNGGGVASALLDGVRLRTFDALLAGVARDLAAELDPAVPAPARWDMRAPPVGPDRAGPVQPTIRGGLARVLVPDTMHV